MSASGGTGREDVALAIGLGWQVALLSSAVADNRERPAAAACLTEFAIRTATFRVLELERIGAVGTLDGTDGLLRATPEHARDRLLEFHTRLLDALGQAGPELTSGYELGRMLGALAGATHVGNAEFPPSLRRVLEPTRVVTLAHHLRTIAASLVPAASRATFHGLELWCDFVVREDDPALIAARDALRGQLRAWRAVLLDQKLPAGLHDGSARPEEGALAQKLTLHDALDLASLHAAFPAPEDASADEIVAEALFAALTVAPPSLPEAPAARTVPPVKERPRARRRRARRLRRAATEVIVVLLAATAVTLVLRSFALETFYVPSGSMSPTIAPGDRILVNKLSSVRTDLHRGDVIVFKRVAADVAPPPTPDLVKRIVGMPGDTIQADSSQILINGKPLAEPWLPRLAGQCGESTYEIPRTVVPPDHYFVMGDCRGDSYDSREWGTVPRSNVIGRVLLVIWEDGHPWVRGL